jgi:hypothetical protein
MICQSNFSMNCMAARSYEAQKSILRFTNEAQILRMRFSRLIPAQKSVVRRIWRVYNVDT